MNPTTIRMIFTGAFALAALSLAGAIELLGNPAPDWLVYIVVAAVSYLFGHVQANGFNGKKGK